MNILIKNMLDAFIGGVSYWAIGWGLAYGEGRHITLLLVVCLTGLYAGGSPL